MGKSKIGRMSELTMDGGFTVIPGFEAGAYDGDKQPFFIDSGAISISATTGNANVKGMMVPFNATLVKALYSWQTAPTATSVPLNVGVRGTAGKFISALDIYATGTGLNTVSATDIADTEIDAGDIVEFDIDPTATSGGVVGVTLVCVPRNG